MDGPVALTDEAILRNISFYQIVQAINDVVVVTTPDPSQPGPVILYVNPAFIQLTGYSPAEVIGRTPRMLQGPGTDRMTLDAISAGLREGRRVHERVLNFGKNGTPYWVDLRITPLVDDDGAIAQFVAIQRDVTLEKQQVYELQFIADRDALTGVRNRRGFERGLAREIKALETHGGARPRATGLFVAFIDLDRFKQVNDTLGHATGDSVLSGVARRLAENVRAADILGRIGGEEFAVCMPGVALDDADMIAERLRHAIMSKPFDTPSGPVTITVSVGVAAFTMGHTMTGVMMRADQAMYAAKRAGGNQVIFAAR
jgi:diguanylate cyclase (GGDEF)-like protein/PAS domain S-box-containing protein